VTSPAQAAAAAETTGLPPGEGERFAGFGVMGLPFSSGNVLAMRRFPASSIGPAYTSVWHRSPDGRWSFWQDQPDDQSCPRYFATAVNPTSRVDIEISWPSPSTLQIDVRDVGLAWTSLLTSTPVTRVLNAIGRALPDAAWRYRPLLSAMGPVAGRALGAGRVGMVGSTPNDQSFIANPLRMWMIDDSSARLGDEDFGSVEPLDDQARLGDFWIPQRGVFTIGRVSFAAEEG
jgi:hypothetical protein